MFDNINWCAKIYSRRSKGPVEKCTENCDWFNKTSSKSNVGRTDRYIFKFFLERESISDFCCNTNQNNPHILKYDSYDRSRLLQPCWKFFSSAPPITLGNFYPLAPPPLRNFHWPSVGGMDIFWNHTLGLSLRAGGWGFLPATINMILGYFHRKIEGK